MNLYEKVVILNPNIEDSAANETIEKIKDIIINKGGEILKTDHWGRRRLAYQLNKHEKGNYTLLLFKSPPTTIVELERLCKVTDSIIKYMVIKLTKKKQIESLLASIEKSEQKAEPVAKDKAVSDEPASTETETAGEDAANKEESENV